jgi:hypothetical protein
LVVVNIKLNRWLGKCQLVHLLKRFIQTAPGRTRNKTALKDKPDLVLLPD